MDIETIKQIAEDRIISDLCIKWFELYQIESLRILTIDELNDKIRLYNEIQKFYKKINQK